MNIRRKARALASSLLILAGLSGAANAQYHVDEVRPHALPTLRSIPTHVPGSSHNLYGPDTVADAIEPVPPTIVSPIEDRRPQPAPAGLVASPARQRELLDEIKAKRNQANAAGPRESRLANHRDWPAGMPKSPAAWRTTTGSRPAPKWS